MSVAAVPESNELAILRRVIDSQQECFSKEAAESILRFDFSSADRERMNHLAAKNREGTLARDEEQELTDYIRVGQVLGILQSKARRSLPTTKSRRKS